MNKFYLITLFVLLFHFSFATPITTTINNGVWNNSNTWDKSRKPQNGDTIVIPSGKTVLITDWQTLNNVYIKVYGKLQFKNVFSALSLNATSEIIVYNNASIETTINYLQYIIIGNNYVFYQGTVNGPLMATSAGFAGFNPLPVQFISFSVNSQNKNNLIQWSTAQEVNVNRYEVQRSIDATNWGTIAYVLPYTNNGASPNNYSFTDKNFTSKIAYYRIKEIDFDGKETYSAIRSIRSEVITTSNIKIASFQNKVLLQFPEQVKGNVLVRFVSFNGQVMDQQNISNPVGQIILNSKVTGNYIISVSNGQDVNTSSQVIL